MAEQKIIPRPRIQAGTNSDMPWGGSRVNSLVAVDCGIHGAVVGGTCLNDVKVIPMPKTALEKRDFFKNLPKHGIDNLCAGFIIERRPATDRIPGGARRVYLVGFEEGSFDVISASFGERIAMYPSQWRNIAFPTVEKKPVGSQEWKRLELRYLKFFTGDRLVKTDREYKSDNDIYGVAAAFCIWLAGAKTFGILDIEKEIKKIKEQ